jgi:hypothetical protein
MKNKILKEAYRCLSSLLIACNEKKRSDVPDKDAIKTEIQAMEDVAAAYNARNLMRYCIMRMTPLVF